MVDPVAGDYSYPKEQGLPLSILENCKKYVEYRLPGTPQMVVIRANLTDDGEIGYITYGDVEHYVVVEYRTGDYVTFSETHFYGNVKSTRTLHKSAFKGFYKL